MFGYSSEFRTHKITATKTSTSKTLGLFYCLWRLCYVQPSREWAGSGEFRIVSPGTPPRRSSHSGSSGGNSDIPRRRDIRRNREPRTRCDYWHHRTHAKRSVTDAQRSEWGRVRWQWRKTEFPCTNTQSSCLPLHRGDKQKQSISKQKCIIVSYNVVTYMHHWQQTSWETDDAFCGSDIVADSAEHSACL